MPAGVLPWTTAWLRHRVDLDDALGGVDDPQDAPTRLDALGTATGHVAADLARLELARVGGGRGATRWDLPRALGRPLVPAELLHLAAPLRWAVPAGGQPTFEVADPEQMALVLSDAWAVCLDSARLNAYHREGTLHLVLGPLAPEIERAHAALVQGQPVDGDLFARAADGWRLRDDLYFRPTPSIVDPDLAVLFHQRDGQRELRVAIGADGLRFFGELLPALRRTGSLPDLRTRFGEGPWRIVERLVEAGALTAVPRTRPLPAGEARARLLAHSAVLLETDATRLLVDPMLVVRARPAFDPFAHLDAPLDAVAITHSHWDHFNLDGLLHVPRTTRVLLPRKRAPDSIVHVDMARVCRELGFTDVVELDPWQGVDVGDIRFTALPYFGEGFGPECPRDWQTFHARLGDRAVVGLVDACRDDFGDMDDVLPEVRARLGPVDVLFAPASGFRFPRSHFTHRPFHLDGSRVPFTGGPEDAARWAAQCGAPILVPYAMFHTHPSDVAHDRETADQDPFRDGSVDRLVAAAGAWPDGRVVVLRPGEALAWTPDRAPHPVPPGR